jgi:putative transferase (TIGR04331 family)
MYCILNDKVLIKKYLNNDYIYLGEWCSNKLFLKHSNFNFTKIRDPWFDRQRRYEAYAYLPSLEKKLLSSVSSWLNNIHSTAYNRRSWSIIIGPWLQRFLHVLYDRYLHIKCASDKYEKLETVILNRKSYYRIIDYGNFLSLVDNDTFNLQIFSDIINNIESSFKVIDQINENNLSIIRDQSRTKDYLKAKKNSFINLIRRANSPCIDESAIFYKLNYRHTSIIDTLIKNTKISSFSSLNFDDIILSSSHTFSKTMRFSQYFNFDTENEFEKLLIKILPSYLPSLYIEDFSVNNKNIIDLFTKGNVPKYIFTNAHGVYHSEPFKFFSAYSVHNKSKLITIQAGGLNGILKYFPQHDHECNISDKFLSWGWQHCKNSSHKNIPCIYTSSIYSDKIPNVYDSEIKKILFMQAGPLGKYMRWFWSAPYRGGISCEYSKKQIETIQRLPLHLQKKVTYRFKKSRNELDSNDKCITKKLNHVSFEYNTKPNLDSMKNSSLILLDHLSTGWLESFAINKPTLIILDDKRWDFNENFKTRINVMVRTNILHFSIKGLIDHINNIQYDIQKWWLSEKIQIIRKECLDNFGYCPATWKNEWEKVIKYSYNS